MASGELDRADPDLAGARIVARLEPDLLPFMQALNSGALKRGGMNEDVLLPVVRLDEAKTFLLVIEFHGARSHGAVPFFTVGVHVGFGAQALWPIFPIRRFERG